MDISNILKTYKQTKVIHPFGKAIDVYCLSGTLLTDREAMFALLENRKSLSRVSLRCERELAKTLVYKYDEVMQPSELNKNKWITVLLSGQLTESEIKDLISHSYDLVKSEAIRQV